MKKIIISFSILSVTLGLTSCEKTETNTNTENCNVTTPTYTTNIKTLIATHCSSCHGSSYQNKGAGVKLDTYSDLKNYASDALGNIKHENGYAAMPKSANKLSDCDISMFENWINQGMKEN